MSSTRPEAAVTSACRRAPTTLRSPSTRFATSPGSAAARSPSAGRSSASAARRRRAAPRRRRATSWASRTAPRTSRRRTRRRSPSTCGSAATAGRAGVDARRRVPRGAAHQDAHRGVGPRPARRPGADDRPPQGVRRAAPRARRVRPSFDPRAAPCPPTRHVRLASPRSTAGPKLLRRGYSLTDGLDDRLGQLDAGLFFLSFQRDPGAFVADPATARRCRRPQRVPQARRLGRLGDPARRAARRLGGPDVARRARLAPLRHPDRGPRTGARRLGRLTTIPPAGAAVGRADQFRSERCTSASTVSTMSTT